MELPSVSAFSLASALGAASAGLLPRGLPQLPQRPIITSKSSSIELLAGSQQANRLLDILLQNLGLGSSTNAPSNQLTELRNSLSQSSLPLSRSSSSLELYGLSLGELTEPWLLRQVQKALNTNPPLVSTREAAIETSSSPINLPPQLQGTQLNYNAGGLHSETNPTLRPTDEQSGLFRRIRPLFWNLRNRLKPPLPAAKFPGKAPLWQRLLQSLRGLSKQIGQRKG